MGYATRGRASSCRKKWIIDNDDDDADDDNHDG